jgi:Ribbon-helix-helix protein, copG family
MKTISLKLPDDLDKELTTRAERRQTTKSTLIREAIKEYLAQAPGPRKGSFLELAGDLIGSVEGPGDLSYNKEYLRLRR